MITRAILFAATILTFGSINSVAQEIESGTPSSESQLPSPESADLSITGSVTARELRFESEPRSSIEFFGTPARSTGWRTERRNLPRDVEPGVTYRDIGVQIEIISDFEDNLNR